MIAPVKQALFRKVLKITAAMSPNVRLAELQIARGLQPTNEIIVEGVVAYATYLQRRATWDKVRQCIGLDAEFYEGAETLLFPPEWLTRAEQIADGLVARKVQRSPCAMGVDTAEGGDDTCWTIIDQLGIIYQESMKTVDTSIIVGRTIALIQQYQLRSETVLFDRGGGGKQHVDVLRMKGYNVRAIAFGEAATTPEGKDIMAIKGNVKVREEKEARYTYKNKRAELYGEVRFRLLDPATNERGFGIPAEYSELRRQLAPIPLWYDGDGKLFLPPKHKKPGQDSEQVTMVDLIGRSPDQADSFCLACHALWHKMEKRVLGAW